MTFEEWFRSNHTNADIPSDPDIREMKEEEYRYEMKAEEERVARFGAEWLEKQRQQLRHGVDEVLRYLHDEELSPAAKFAWLYTEVGEIEYAQFLTILPDRTANKYKNELFDTWQEVKQGLQSNENEAC